MTYPPAVRALLREQSNVATVQQLLDAGMTRSAVRHLVGRRLRFVAPRVVAEIDSGGLSPRQRMVAAQLYAGTDAVITGRAAAAWHGVTAAEGFHTIKVEVPQARRPRGRPGIAVRRTTRPEPAPWSRPPLVIASRARAVVQAARDSDVDSARAIVLEAVQRRLVLPDDLLLECDAGESDGSAKVRGAIDLGFLGAWSVSEAELLEAVGDIPGIAPPMLNPLLVVPDGTLLPRPDAWFDDVALALQVHSRRHHAAEADFDDTVMTDGVFAEYGIPVLALTPARIRSDRALVRRRVERAVQAAAQRPRPAVTVLSTAGSAA